MKPINPLNLPIIPVLKPTRLSLLLWMVARRLLYMKISYPLKSCIKLYVEKNAFCVYRYCSYISDLIYH